MAHADGTIFYRADRQKWVAVLDGYQMAARNTAEACKNFLINKGFKGEIVIIDGKPLTPKARNEYGAASVSNVDGDINTWIKVKAKDVIDQANSMFGLSLQPRIDFCRGTAGGKARGTSELWFNSILAAENKDEFPQTIKHEVAHLVINAKYPRTIFGGRTVRSHGPEFMNVLVKLGGRPERCHSMDTSNSAARTVKRYPATCGCKTYMFTLTRIRRGVERYSCRKCGNTLKLVK